MEYIRILYILASILTLSMLYIAYHYVQRLSDADRLKRAIENQNVQRRIERYSRFINIGLGLALAAVLVLIALGILLILFSTIPK